MENRDNVGFRHRTPELTVAFCYLFIMIENGVFDCLSRKLSMLINELVAMQVACLMDFWDCDQLIVFFDQLLAFEDLHKSSLVF